MGQIYKYKEFHKITRKNKTIKILPLFIFDYDKFTKQLIY